MLDHNSRPDSLQPKPRFTGIFIPVEILELQELSLLDQMLLSWIDALYCRDYGGCFASNEYLATRLKVKVDTISKSLTKLKRLDLIKEVSFDGRRRVIKACVKEFVEKSQSYADQDLNPMQTRTKILGGLGEKSYAINIYKKEERKEDILPRNPRENSHTASPIRERTPDISFSFEKREFENIADQDITSWKEAYPNSNIQQELKVMIQWILANPTKTKSRKSWRKFIVNWLQKSDEKSMNRTAYQSMNQKSQKDQLLSRHTGLQKDHSPRNVSRTLDFSDCT